MNRRGFLGLLAGAAAAPLALLRRGDREWRGVEVDLHGREVHGGRTVRVFGRDANGAEVTEDVELNGTTPVVVNRPLTDISLSFCRGERFVANAVFPVRVP